VFNCLNKPLKIYHCSSVGDLYPLVDGDDLPDKGVSEGYKVVRGTKENVKVELGAKQCSAVFVENSEADNVRLEEMFPISSDSVPEEEKHKHYEVLSTYADCISRGPCLMLPIALKRRGEKRASDATKRWSISIT